MKLSCVVAMRVVGLSIGGMAFLIFAFLIWQGREGHESSGGAATSERVDGVVSSPSHRKVSEVSGARTVDELTNLIDVANYTWRQSDFTDVELEGLRQEFIKGWSRDEVEAVCRRWMIEDDGEIFVQRSRGPDRLWRRELWVGTLFQRWGELSPEMALTFVREFEDEALKQTQTFDTTWAMGSPLFYAAKRFSAVVVGWSVADPLAAYEALKSGQVAMRDTESFDEWYPVMIGGVFEHLSQVEPEFALSEFRGNSDDLVRAKMLEGISTALPLDYDYQVLFADLRSEIQIEEEGAMKIMRGKVLSRWLESDPDEALAWYRSAGADWLMPVHRHEPSKLEGEGLSFELDASGRSLFLFEEPLASALCHWSVRSPEQAIDWLQNHPEFVPAVIAEAWEVGMKRSDRRELLVLTLTTRDRERYLLSQFGDQEFGDLVVRSTKEESLRNIRELKVGKSVEEKLIEKYLRENPDLFGLEDPFGRERK